MKKLVSLLAIIAAAAAAWFFLLRPTSISQAGMTAEYEAHKTDFKTIADYLVKNKVSTTIDDIMIAGREFGVPNVDDDEYRSFNLAVEELMKTPFQTIVSDSGSVTFVYKEEGGYLNRLYGSVIYNGADELPGKRAVRLAEPGWHLYIAPAGK